MDAARWQTGRKPVLPIPGKIEERRVKRQSGRLFFAYFLLAEKCSCIFGIRHILVACGAKDKFAGSEFGDNPKGKTQGWVLQCRPLAGAGTGFKKRSSLRRKTYDD